MRFAFGAKWGGRTASGSAAEAGDAAVAANSRSSRSDARAIEPMPIADSRKKWRRVTACSAARPRWPVVRGSRIPTPA